MSLILVGFTDFRPHSGAKVNDSISSLFTAQRPPPHTACQEITNDWTGLYQDIGFSRAVLSPILTYAPMGCDCHRAVRLPRNCAVPARNHNFASLTARLKPMP